MNALSLFSGIGGIDLACEWAGIKTVAFCEREPFCQKVLRKHWPDVPIYDDVCKLTKARLDADGIGTIDLIHGGGTHANLTVLPGSDEARKMTAHSGQKLSACYKRSDPVGICVKMLLETSLWGSMTCFLTWRVSVTPRRRLVFQLVPSVPYIEETGFLFLPTPTASMWRGTSRKRFKGSPHYKGSFTQEALRNGPDDPQYINPNYLEILMGFPIRWTELKPSETP